MSTQDVKVSSISIPRSLKLVGVIGWVWAILLILGAIIAYLPGHPEFSLFITYLSDIGDTPGWPQIIFNSSTLIAVFYTLNGSDPRARDNQPSAGAVAYAGPVILAEDSLVQARIRAENEAGNGYVWSDLAQDFVVLEIPTLAVTEIMYNPVGGTDYEFIEFFNRGDRPVKLNGIIADGRGPIFDFSQSKFDVLEPRQYIVLVKNLAVFQQRYDTTKIKIAGVFDQNRSNTSQNINLKLTGVPDPFLTLNYKDTWYPTTDNGGDSLVLIDPHSSASKA